MDPKEKQEQEQETPVDEEYENRMQDIEDEQRWFFAQAEQEMLENER